MSPKSGQRILECLVSRLDRRRFGCNCPAHLGSHATRLIKVAFRGSVGKSILYRSKFSRDSVLYSSGNIFRYSIHAHKYMEVDAMMMGERNIYFYLPSHTQPEVVTLVLVIVVTVLLVVTNTMK